MKNEIGAIHKSVMIFCTLYKWKFKGTACGYITHVLHRETSLCLYCTKNCVALAKQNPCKCKDQITGNYIWQ